MNFLMDVPPKIGCKSTIFFACTQIFAALFSCF
jgi:hypothetical protein